MTKHIIQRVLISLEGIVHNFTIKHGLTRLMESNIISISISRMSNNDLLLKKVRVAGIDKII